MNKKIGLILLAIVVTIGIGVGAALASPDHSPEQHVFLRASVADTGCEYVSLTPDLWPEAVPQMETWWASGTLSAQFLLNGVYPGFGQNLVTPECSRPCYVLYFLRNEDKEPSTVGAIDVHVDITPPGAMQIKWETYDSIMDEVRDGVYQQINKMGLTPEVTAAMKDAFERGCIETGDALAPSPAVGENPLAWGCYGMTVRVPDAINPEGNAPPSATISISIAPPESELQGTGPHFLDSTDLEN
ncbi:MAG: hypothetical protein FJZ95_10595 [Chloroflexi bacterium]|nr:hypothetical protein [Chloroflexota bacterium]